MSKNEDTKELLDSRESTYGNVVDNAQRVANMWNGYLGTDIITAADMMMMMALYKAYRFKVTPDYSDNINDVLGYAEIVRNVQRETGGLIDAETVKEYVAKKAGTSGAIVERLLQDLDQSEGEAIESFQRRSGNTSGAKRPVRREHRHPYEVADELAATEEKAEELRKEQGYRLMGSDGRDHVV